MRTCFELVLKIALAALLSLPLLSSGSLAADPHTDLVAAIQETGTEFLLTGDDCGTTVLGFYESGARRLTVCAEQGVAHMDAEQLDTLRHEAIHLVQDCLGGGRAGDLALQRIFNDEITGRMVATSGVDPDRIHDAYVMLSDADEHVVALEVEAFAAAGSLGGDEVAWLVRRACGLS